MNRAEKLEHIKGKYAVIVAIISFAGLIISSIISIFSIDLNKTLTQENTKLLIKNNDWEIAYNELHEDFDELNNKNNSLSREVTTLKNSMEQYFPLETENESLKEEISELKKEIQLLATGDTQGYTKEDLDFKSFSNDNLKKVSIFDLDTFKGNNSWCKATHKYQYTDTYDNEYPNAYFDSHYATTKEDDYKAPTYLLDKKYVICEGQITWSKESKNLDGSAWIEFYSDDNLIYTTEPITADSRVLTFSFSVEGIEKLTIVKTGSRNENIVYDRAYIIYPYLNLVE